jgi:hypothetical protein
MSEYKMFLVSDISGSPVLGISSGWTSDYRADGVAVSGSSVTISEVSSGYYKALVTPVPAGEITLALTNSNTDYQISPTWHEWTTTNYGTDDIYGKLTVVGVSNLPSSSPARFTVVSINTKQDADVIETIQVPNRFLPLTGYTNMTVQCFPQTRLNDSTVPPISGTYSAIVLSETEGTVEIKVGDDVLSNLIPQGSSSTIIYGDLKYFDANGNERRPVELQITVRRDFNNNN